MAFAYTLIVRLPTNRRLGHEAAELELTWLDRTVTVKPIGAGSTIKDAEWLKFASVGFLDEAEAEAHGRSLKGYLRLAAVRSHLPFDLGRETTISATFAPVTDSAAEQGVRLLPSVHGLMVYEQTGLDRLFWGTATGLASTPKDKFVTALQDVAHLSPPLDGSRLALACDLYSQALFATSRSAQFVALVTAIESLIKRRPLPSAVRAILKQAEQAVNEELGKLASDGNEALLQTMSGGFHDLRRESISQAFRRLAETYGNPAGYDGVPPAEFAATVYRLRSKVVHGTDVADPLPVAQLMQLVSDIILGTAGAERGAAASGGPLATATSEEP